MTTKHTHTPEQLWPRHPLGGMEAYADHASHKPVATFTSEELCDEVIRRYNTHADLVAALEAVLEEDMQDQKSADEFGGFVLPEDLRLQAKAALAKARGEEVGL